MTVGLRIRLGFANNGLSRRHCGQSGKQALEDPGSSAAIIDRGSIFNAVVRRTTYFKEGVPTKVDFGPWAMWNPPGMAHQSTLGKACLQAGPEKGLVSHDLASLW